jgi:predicted aspartyl protease
MIQKIIALILIAIIMAFVIISLKSGAVNLGDYATNLAVGLTIVAFSIGYWAYKSDINGFIKRKMIEARETKSKSPSNIKTDIEPFFDAEIHNRFKQQKFSINSFLFLTSY